MNNILPYANLCKPTMDKGIIRPYAAVINEDTTSLFPVNPDKIGNLLDDAFPKGYYMARAKYGGHAIGPEYECDCTIYYEKDGWLCETCRGDIWTYGDRMNDLPSGTAELPAVIYRACVVVFDNMSDFTYHKALGTFHVPRGMIDFYSVELDPEDSFTIKEALNNPIARALVDVNYRS